MRGPLTGGPFKSLRDKLLVAGLLLSPLLPLPDYGQVTQ